MTDNTKMVDLPWHDGTTRTVPEGTVYESEIGGVYVAREDGYSFVLDPKKEVSNKLIYPHFPTSAAIRIFTEAPEPPVKVDVPTGIGAVVSSQWNEDMPTFVLDHQGWRGLMSGERFEAGYIADMLRNGARVLYEGVDEEV